MSDFSFPNSGFNPLKVELGIKFPVLFTGHHYLLDKPDEDWLKPKKLPKGATMSKFLGALIALIGLGIIFFLFSPTNPSADDSLLKEIRQQLGVIKDRIAVLEKECPRLEKELRESAPSRFDGIKEMRAYDCLEELALMKQKALELEELIEKVKALK